MSINPNNDHHRVLVDTAKDLYDHHFASSSTTADGTKGGKPTVIAVAPGRVNLIGEHVDYTGGFVLPFAIEYATVVCGRGRYDNAEDADDDDDNDDDDTNHTSRPRSTKGQRRTCRVQFVSAQQSSDNNDETHTFDLDADTSKPPPADQPTEWTTYVIGTIMQYLPDLPEGTHLTLSFGLAGNVPLGSGLSSSAALEIAVARFVEAVLGDGIAFSSDPAFQSSSFSPAKIRALRCQKAENEWCHSPCGIMDQAISSAAPKGGGSLLLIDCRSLTFEETKMASTTSPPTPVLVVTNSHVKHDIAGGEYPVRVAQCQTATKILQHLQNDLTQLRDASPELVESAQEQGLFSDDPVSYKRARHVTTENERTLQAKDALEEGEWTLVGSLMNASHASMCDDYEVSCEEIDILVDLAQNFDGVYGSRLTGGGFGGCTVTLVDPNKATSLMAYLRKEYQSKTGVECDSFETRPAAGAHLLSIRNYQPLV